MKQFDPKWLEPGAVIPVNPIVTGALLAEITRLRERCEAYKGQVECGASEITRLKDLIESASNAWCDAQDACPHTIPADKTEGQGICCRHDDNTSSMGWCQPSDCPFFPEL